MFEHIIDVITILLALAPLGVKLFSLIAQKTHDQRLINLSNRATIVVTALENQDLTNEEKKQRAFEKLAFYAKEVGIPVTGGQLDDYVESANTILKGLKNKGG